VGGGGWVEGGRGGVEEGGGLGWGEEDVSDEGGGLSTGEGGGQKGIRMGEE